MIFKKRRVDIKRPNECPYCKSEKVAVHQVVATVHNGTKQRFRCMKCGKSFYLAENKARSKKSGN